MLKLRTMHLAGDDAGPRITGAKDPRVFAFGALLRRLKIDELPQLINVLRGEMSLVGPRPEDPVFVARHYAPEHRETLKVLAGMAPDGAGAPPRSRGGSVAEPCRRHARTPECAAGVEPGRPENHRMISTAAPDITVRPASEPELERWDELVCRFPNHRVTHLR